MLAANVAVRLAFLRRDIRNVVVIPFVWEGICSRSLGSFALLHFAASPLGAVHHRSPDVQGNGTNGTAALLGNECRLVRMRVQVPQRVVERLAPETCAWWS